MAIREKPITLLSAFSTLFYFSKIFGIISHSFSHFYSHKVLKVSKLGILLCFIMLSIYNSSYHFVTELYTLYDKNEKQSTLTTAIGLLLNYVTPIMISVDIIVGIINRNRLINVFDQIKLLDERLHKEQIFIDNSKLKKHSRILIAIIIFGETIVSILTIFVFMNPAELLSWITNISSLPSILNGIEKIWFILFLLILRERFAAMNQYLDNVVNEYSNEYNNYNEEEIDKNGKIFLKRDKYYNEINENKNQKNDNDNNDNADDDDDDFDVNLGYLHKEIILRNATKSFKINASDFRKNNKIIPVLPWTDKIFCKSKLFKVNALNDVKKMEIKLTIICQLHDEYCEIGKIINTMWSLQMLLVMAHGFLTITTQLYFLYCSIVGQNVPGLFRYATSAYIVCVSIAYVAGKCVYIIYLSWQTTLESRRTGVCFHKCGLAIDENNFYEMINHLSLKLMNHSINFTACGFFNLDMTTLYAVTGAITSYLIILIQFNLAGHSKKSSVTNGTVTTPTSATATVAN